MPTTELLGRLRVQVVEAKGLTVRNRDQKPYVLVQYDRTDSISRAFGETASTNSSPVIKQEGEKEAKKPSAIRRLRPTTAEGAEGKPQGITVKRKVGPVSSTSGSNSSSPRTSNGTTDSTPSLWKATGDTLSSKGTFSASSTSTVQSSPPTSPMSKDSSSLPDPIASSESEGNPPSADDEGALPSSSQFGTPSSPIWSHATTFDVISPNRTLLICVYDKNASLTPTAPSSSSNPTTNYIHGFLGASVFEPPLLTDERQGEELDVWVPLTCALDDSIGGEIRIKLWFEPLKVRTIPTRTRMIRQLTDSSPERNSLDLS